MGTQKHYVKTALRMPPDLHAAIHASAEESERTFNAEILHRLRASYKPTRETPVSKTGKGEGPNRANG